MLACLGLDCLKKRRELSVVGWSQVTQGCPCSLELHPMCAAPREHSLHISDTVFAIKGSSTPDGHSLIKYFHSVSLGESKITLPVLNHR